MKKIIAFFVSFMLILAVSACSLDSTATATQLKGASATTAPAAVATKASTASSVTPAATTASNVPTASASSTTEPGKTHDEPEDYVWDSATVIPIVLNGNSAAANNQAVTVSGSKVTITRAGTYSLSGALTDGQVIVDTADKGIVRLILNGVDIRSSSSSPIYVLNSNETMIVLADNTQNSVSDGSKYLFANATNTEPNAAIFSTADLTIHGNGSLTVKGNFNDGIASKDGLIIDSGTIMVTSVDDGIRGKDFILIKNGTITVNAQGDGLKSDNAEEPTRGYISVVTGNLNITARGDAITAETNVLVANGNITISSGGGSTTRVDANTSAKGIKAGVNVTINSGTFNINSADDAINSNNSVVINGGTFNIATGDDGVHGDATLQINGGEIRITKSYEGLESAVLTINSGTIHIIASDDGINAAGGRDGSGTNMTPGGMRGRGPGQDAFSASGAYYLYIHGGYIAVEANGDGLDINGGIEMTGGTLLVNGPTANNNGALDYDRGFKMTGGYLIAAGSSGMAQAPDATSSVYSVLVNFTSTQKAGTLVTIKDSQGKVLFTFAPTKLYQSIAFSVPALTKGSTYDIYLGGSSTGTVTDSLVQNGTYTAGTKYSSFMISSVVTKIGSGGGGFRP